MFLIDYYNNNNKNKSLLIIHSFIFLITVCCFSYFDYFLLSDYPNYLARIELFNNLSETHILSEYYYKNMKITPYMGFPVIVGFLEPLLGIYWAGKIFIVFALSMIVSGGLLLNYTLYNRITPFSLFIHIFMFNFTLSMGFMNFTLGLGLILWGFASWIRYHNHTLKFYALFALYAIIVFCIHIFALFLLGLVIGLYQLSISPKSTIKNFFKSSFYAGLKILTFTIIPICITPLVAITDIGFPPITGHCLILQHIVMVLLAPLWFSDSFLAIAIQTLLILLVILRKIDFKLPFIFVCLFIGSFFIPFFVGGVAYVNIRIPALLGLLFAVSTTFQGKTKQVIFCSILSSIFCIYLYVNHLQLLYHQNHYVSEFVEKIRDDKNLKGKKLLTVNDSTITHYPWGYQIHYSHLSSYAVLEANMFVPELMTGIPPIGVYDKYSSIDAKMDNGITADELRLSPTKAQKYIHPIEKETGYPYHFYWKNWRQDFDYVFWIHTDKKPKDVPNELSVYKKGSFFTLYKINKKQG